MLSAKNIETEYFSQADRPARGKLFIREKWEIAEAVSNGSIVPWIDKLLFIAAM